MIIEKLLLTFLTFFIISLTGLRKIRFKSLDDLKLLVLSIIFWISGGLVVLLWVAYIWFGLWV